MCTAVERCLAVGVFDGVHLGHREILQGVDVALTFSRHPLELINPQRSPKLIMPLDERVAAIEQCGVKKVEVLDFTSEMAAVSAADFAAGFLGVGSAGLKTKIRCGANWRFGRSGEGDANWLAARGVEVEVAPYAVYRGEAVSSSRIRRSLARGEIEHVNNMLGRRYGLTGNVVSGKGRGAQLGYPTVNLEVSTQLSTGVYEVEISGVRGIANYGFAPTMGAEAWSKPVLEVHLLGGEKKITSNSLKVEFVRFIRAERRFASVEELCRQIADDVKSVLSEN
jgi:riboflavin kinase/FMN adenylyltransferase